PVSGSCQALRRSPAPNIAHWAASSCRVCAGAVNDWRAVSAACGEPCRPAPLFPMALGGKPACSAACLSHDLIGFIVNPHSGLRLVAGKVGGFAAAHEGKLSRTMAREVRSFWGYQVIGWAR